MIDRNQQLIDLLDWKLGDLAMSWYGNRYSPQAEQYVHQYHAVMNCLLALGWEGGLDLEAELPEEFMPEAYLNRFGRRW